MLMSEYSEVRWNSKNKSRFESLGYKYTTMKDTFNVRVEDLSHGSNAIVEVKCDYCGNVFNTSWYIFLHGRRNGLKKDCCSNPECTGQKAADAMDMKYGVKYSAYLPETIQKRKATCLERYGAENPFASSEIKEKIAQINTEKYGVPYSQQNPYVREKTIRTCRERYGVSNYVELFAGKFIGENSPVWKGGPVSSGVDRASHEYIEWRNSVFKRDFYRCQCCGAKNGDGSGEAVVLNAHHIKNWADNPAERYDIDNGITLCKSCHMLFHSTYGKKENTYLQLVDFITGEKVC